MLKKPHSHFFIIHSLKHGPATGALHVAYKGEVSVVFDEFPNSCGVEFVDDGEDPNCMSEHDSVDLKIERYDGDTWLCNISWSVKTVRRIVWEASL